MQIADFSEEQLKIFVEEIISMELIDFGEDAGYGGSRSGGRSKRAKKVKKVTQIFKPVIAA